jgi:hypothetical protein
MKLSHCVSVACLSTFSMIQIASAAKVDARRPPAEITVADMHVVRATARVLPKQNSLAACVVNVCSP